MLKWGWILIGGLLVGLGQACSNSGQLSTSESTVTAAADPGCTTPDGMSGAPQSIDEAVQLINALPKPLTIGCFLQSLARPLKVNLTNSTTSAQPADSTSNPRIFVMMDALVISVVPKGVGSKVVEFSQFVDSSNTIKGEIEFPVQQNMARSAPFDRIRFGSGTVCVFCHSGESRYTAITYADAFQSKAFRPRPDTVVPLSGLKNEFSNCSPALEPERCQILRGLFGQGQVIESHFPSALPTFF